MLCLRCLEIVDSLRFPSKSHAFLLSGNAEIRGSCCAPACFYGDSLVSLGRHVSDAAFTIFGPTVPRAPGCDRVIMGRIENRYIRNGYCLRVSLCLLASVFVCSFSLFLPSYHSALPL